MQLVTIKVVLNITNEHLTRSILL